jgi:D-beta-D-heptose 7-phosphate kinase/D-beta-D-heptose 1-phosphate adenosyltransferase
MITLGEEGIALFEPGKALRRFPAQARQVFDVTGAGDTVVACATLVLAAGGDLEEAAVFANHAAAIVVGRVGTAAPEPTSILTAFMDEILGEPLGEGGGAVLERGQAAAWGEAQRRQGKRIVFTNGCFDILHFGHLALLSGAARQGDVLAVGLNSDDSVRRLKGPSRPVNGLAERARLLAHLRSVDAVFPFEEDTPLELIREIRPQVLVKGAEYGDEAIVGAAEVKSWGGSVVRFPMQGGYSTTLLLAGGREAKTQRKPEARADGEENPTKTPTRSPV